ncbi:hypothetical protein [Streptomyces sp. NPDC026673]|uniref:hypothetical protein n=1 Tax=Streptomyces sp. NPDC026673 TaxID=3155724 RepID=UPI00340340A8
MAVIANGDADASTAAVAFQTQVAHQPRDRSTSHRHSRLATFVANQLLRENLPVQRDVPLILD